MRFHLDFETEAVVDLTVVGTYVYANHPRTEVTHAALTVEGGERILFQKHRDPSLTQLSRIADLVVAYLKDEKYIVAHNAAFEFQILLYTVSRMLGRPIPVEARNFDCTMARCLNMGLPGGLDAAAQALGLETVKDKLGKAMMEKHCKPCPYVNDKGEPIFWRELTQEQYVSQELDAFIARMEYRKRQPKNAAAAIEKKRQELIAKFETFDFMHELDLEGAYCVQDVAVEEAIDKWVPKLSKIEFETWVLDQQINLAGVYLNTEKVRILHEAVKIVLSRADSKIEELTNGYATRVTQNARIVKWLQDRGIPCEGTAKDKIEELLVRAELLGDDEAKEVIKVRASGGQSAVTKLPVMLATSDEHGLSRGLLQYYGAATGRWSARLWQPHNVKRLGKGAVERLDELLTFGTSAEDLVAASDLLDIDLFGAIGDAMRSLLEAPEGLFYVGGDFSNIEGRGNAWLAGEDWKVQAFLDFDRGIGHDLYKLAYARAFSLRPEDVDDDGRQKGKVMELALGYQGGVNAFQTMAKNYRLLISDDEADVLKLGWREAHPKIKAGWYALENAAIAAIQKPQTKQVVFDGKIVYLYDGNHLWCKVPRGGVICYPFAYVKFVDKWGDKKLQNDPDLVIEADPLEKPKVVQLEPVVFFKGLGKARQWTTKSLYGGLQCENVTQRVARDVLDDKMKAAVKAGFDIRLHVHDEIQAIDKDPGRKAELELLMCEPLPWCPGYPIAAKCASDRRYIK